MQGKILSAASQSVEGLILGDDGVRYPFTLEEWRSDEIAPADGMRVEFGVRGSDAAEVHPIPEASPTPPTRRPARKRLLWAMLVGVGALVVLGIIVTVALGTCTDPNEERVEFDSERDGNGEETSVMDADDSGAPRLTDNKARDWSPRWSPDGRRIAFLSNRDGNSEIYVMNADGSGVTRLTDNEADDRDLSWSLDGRRILFHSDRYSDRYKERRVFVGYVMNADGSDVRERILNVFDVLGRRPKDHPRTVYTSSEKDGASYIKVDTPDHSVITLTDSGADKSPRLSPDGRLIVFESERDGNWEIYVMNADGSDQTRLTENEAEDADPIWSPDGRRIAFLSNRDGRTEIYRDERGRLGRDQPHRQPGE